MSNPHTKASAQKPATSHAPWYASHRAPLYFLVLSILCQIIGIGILSLVRDALVHPLLLLAMQALVAFFVARWLSLSLPWQLFNLLLAPGVILYTFLELPSGLAFAALVVAMLLYAPTFWTRVPYFPTHLKMYERILALIPADKELKFIDLGCGNARLLVFLAKSRPQASFVGVEISPLAYAAARLWVWGSGASNVTIQWRNFWNLSLEPFDVVYAFLAPGPMPGLWEKAQAEMQPGSVFITNTFTVDSSESETERIDVDESHQHALFVHRR